MNGSRKHGDVSSCVQRRRPKELDTGQKGNTVRIALCEDNPKDLAVLANLLDRYRRETKASLSLSAYTSGVALFDDMRKEVFDLLLLDVMMPFVDGMQIAREIREFDENVKIAFLTSSPEFAVQSYEVDAFHYLLKPVSYDKLFPMLDKLRLRIEEHGAGLAVRLKSGAASILFARIAYVEVLNRTVRFHLTDKSVREVAGSLSDFEPQLLSQPEFIRVHRAFIVNLDQVQELEKLSLRTFSDESVPVSRRLFGEVKAAYLKRLFVQAGMA